MLSIPFLSLLLLWGDILLFYGSLGLTLLLRYPYFDFSRQWDLHIVPFTLLLFLWIPVFYIGGLYERKFLKATAALEDRIARVAVVTFVLSVILFYIIPSFGITPKTNLLIHSIIIVLLISGWRMFIARFISQSFKIRVLFFGLSKEIEAMIETLSLNPQLGYEPAALMMIDSSSPPEFRNTRIDIFPFDHNLADIIHKKRIHLVISSSDIKKNETVVRMLYQVLPLGISFMDFPTFYERLTGKIPISFIGEVWFLENLAQLTNIVNAFLKRFLDIILAVVGSLFLTILFPFIAVAIKLNSAGPIFIRQTRVGKNGSIFTLIKFRSMIALSSDGLAESGSARWASKEDKRITRVGSFLRKTHIDELPQIWNVIKGDISVVGPRPERPEFIAKLEKIIPHYNMRHLVKPGVTGWAQINMPGVYAGSIEETIQKLQYDLYYIKYQSVVMDIAIILKTILLTLTRKGR